MEFNCTACGLCCTQIGKLIATREEFKNFPYKTDEKGKCEKLNDDGKCSVYESRPDICRVDKTHEKYFSHLDKLTFYELNYINCRELQSQTKT